MPPVDAGAFPPVEAGALDAGLGGMVICVVCGVGEEENACVGERRKEGRKLRLEVPAASRTWSLFVSIHSSAGLLPSRKL